MLSVLTRARFWNTVSTPRSRATLAPWPEHTLPSINTSPVSGLVTPEMIDTSVLLPAPLSPTRASTSPRRSSTETPRSAATGPYRLLTPRTTSVAPSVVPVTAPAVRPGWSAVDPSEPAPLTLLLTLPR